MHPEISFWEKIIPGPAFVPDLVHTPSMMFSLPALFFQDYLYGMYGGTVYWDDPEMYRQ